MIVGDPSLAWPNVRSVGADHLEPGRYTVELSP
jgi:hypothetical protein